MNKKEFMQHNKKLWDQIDNDNKILNDLEKRERDTINDRKHIYNRLHTLRDYKITMHDLKKQELYVLVAYDHYHHTFIATAQIGLNFTNYDFEEPAFINPCDDSLFDIYADPLFHFTKRVIDEARGLKAKYPNYHIYCLNDYNDEQDFINHVSNIKYTDV